MKSFIFRERGNKIFRFIDKYIGIPLVFLLGLMRRKNKQYDITSFSKIIIIRLGAIGDTLFIIPLLESIREKNPEVYIHFLCSEGNKEVVERLKIVNLINSYNILSLSKLLFNPLYLFRTLINIRKKKYDVLLDFEPWARISSVISFFVKSNVKVGFKRKKQYRHYTFDIAVEHSDSKHEFDNYKSLLKILNINVNEKKDIKFPILDKEKVWAEEFLRRKNIDKFVVFHPWGAGYKSSLREWGDENFVKLAEYLIGKGFSIVITGGRSDMEKSESLAKKINKDGRCVSVAGQITLGETAVLLNKAQFVVSINTGIAHLASSVGAKLIVLNGPTDKKRWGALGNNSINMKSPAFCSPCLDLGFEYKCKKYKVADGWCMTLIRPEDVISVIEQYELI